jgi:hypothetical protein
MGLVITAKNLASRAIRKTVGKDGNGIRSINSKLAAGGKKGNWFFDIAGRFVGWLGIKAGAFLQWGLSNIANWLVQGAIQLYYFDWNQSDAAIAAQIKSNNLAIARSAGAAAGTALAWTVCTAVGALVEFTFPVLRGRVVAELAAEGSSEAYGAIRAFLAQTTASLGQNLTLWGYSNVRKFLNPNGDYNKPGAKPYILADELDKKIDKISNEYLKNAAQGFKEAAEDALMDCFYTMGYLIKMGVDDHYATTKVALANQLGTERTIEITPDKEVPNEKIIMHGNEALLKTGINTTLATHKMVRNRDIGMMVGQPAEDFLKGNTVYRKLVLVFRDAEKPPWNLTTQSKDGKTKVKRGKTFSCSIPDAIQGLSWEKIKEFAKPFQWGEHSCTVKLDNNRAMTVYGATKATAEKQMKLFLKLTTAKAISWHFHEEGEKKNPNLIKRSLQVYPFRATLLVRKDNVDGDPDINLASGKKLDEKKYILDLWPDKKPADATTLR